MRADVPAATRLDHVQRTVTANEDLPRAAQPRHDDLRRRSRCCRGNEHERAQHDRECTMWRHLRRIPSASFRCRSQNYEPNQERAVRGKSLFTNEDVTLREGWGARPAAASLASRTCISRRGIDCTPISSRATCRSPRAGASGLTTRATGGDEAFARRRPPLETEGAEHRPASPWTPPRN